MSASGVQGVPGAQGDAGLTYGLLAKALQVTVTTIKSYRRKFPEFWRAESLGKPIRFPARTLDLCRRIQQCFTRGLSVEETRKRLAAEFEAFQAPGDASGRPDLAGSPDHSGRSDIAGRPNQSGRDCPAAGPDPGGLALAPEPLARFEALMEGLFTLQNRTHSLLAELVAKLDTVADRLGPGAPIAALSGAERGGGPAGPGGRSESSGLSGQPRQPRQADQADQAGPSGQADQAEQAGPSSPAGPAGHAKPSPDGLSAPGLPGAGGPSVPGTGAGSGEVLPPAAFLDLPVVVLSGDGEHLGVASRLGRPFTLAQFKAFLVRRAEGLGRFETRWLREGQEWTLRLSSQGQTHDHHFLQARTQRGNTVAVFASLSVAGKPVSDVALRTFLRQVKETLDQ